MAGDGVGVLLVRVVQGVVGEGDGVDERDEEEGPVVAAGRGGGVGAVVDGEEDVCRVGEVGQGVLEA